MDVPQGFEKYFPPGVVLLLLKTIYGSKQAAKRFWLFLLGLFRKLSYNYNRVDPCLYFKWTALGNLIVWLSWVDDCVCFGQSQDVKTTTDEMKSLFECDDVEWSTILVDRFLDRQDYEFGTIFNQNLFFLRKCAHVHHVVINITLEEYFEDYSEFS